MRLNLGKEIALIDDRPRRRFLRSGERANFFSRAIFADPLKLRASFWRKSSRRFFTRLLFFVGSCFILRRLWRQRSLLEALWYRSYARSAITAIYLESQVGWNYFSSFSECLLCEFWSLHNASTGYIIFRNVEFLCLDKVSLSIAKKCALIE